MSGDTEVRTTRLGVAVAINVAIVITQIVVGLYAHSISLISDAAHNLTDVAAIGLAAFALQLTRRPATSRRSYGWHRGTILAAQANAALILAVAAGIFYEGIRRVIDPPVVHAVPVIIVALGAFVANAIAAAVVRDPHRHDHDHRHIAQAEHHHERPDLNIQAVMLHLASDAAASFGVAASGVVIWLTGGWRWLDPGVSLAIGALIAWHAWHLLRSSNAVLLEATPEGLEPLDLHHAMLDVDGVDAVHDLHVWSLSSRYTALSAHVVVHDGSTLAEAQAVAVVVRGMLASRFGIDHSTLELEEVACADNGAHCEQF